MHGAHVIAMHVADADRALHLALVRFENHHHNGSSVLTLSFPSPGKFRQRIPRLVRFRR